MSECASHFSKKNILILFLVCLNKYGRCNYFYPVHYPIATTTSPLPEIIINKNLPGKGSGYSYPAPDHPLQPPQVLPPLVDEIPEVVKPAIVYLPPDNINEIQQPSSDYLPPVYGPPVQSKSFNQLPTNVRVSSMACLDSSQNRFFRAFLQSPDFVNAMPVLPKAFGCRIPQQKQNDVFEINLEGAKVGECGVRYCASKKMCLNVRLPTIKGLQLADDRVISLQCEPQSSTASVVKYFGVKAQPQLQQTGRARNLGLVASGGAQRPFEPHIAIYRKNAKGIFTDLLEPGSVVELGDELLLKATVKESDGWKFSKMTTVVIQQESQASINKKAVTLVNADGCRNDAMKLICPEQPKYLSNLITIVPFRTFMFQDSDNDEMLLSVRLFGCLHYDDCQSNRCDEKANVISLDELARKRAKRAIAAKSNSMNGTQEIMELVYNSPEAINATHNLSRNSEDFHEHFRNSVQDYETYFDFSVVKKDSLSKNKPIGNENKVDYYYANYEWFLVVCALFVAALVALSFLNIVVNMKSYFRRNMQLFT